ncbi:MAG TPA: type II toxin-antitoxin system Phd/YefM family antitoxin, partial [Xanthobacteraceae bacterium]|nr:type II toxin-antitoxin system Phd/YefM family antitoxin [Xanthobacteraceae bacterium]
MRNWPVQDAKARFSEMLETCLKEGPQLVTRRGAEAAVLVPVEEWERLNRARHPTLKEWLLT